MIHAVDPALSFISNILKHNVIVDHTAYFVYTCDKGYDQNYELTIYACNVHKCINMIEQLKVVIIILYEFYIYVHNNMMSSKGR